MRRFLAIAGVLSLALIMAGGLTGCAPRSADTIAGVTDIEQPAGGVGPAQKAADRLLGEATGPDQRGLRLCMIITGVSELMADRVTLFDVEYAPTALGQLATLKGVQRRFDAAGGTFFETDVQLATLQLTSILVEVGKDRVPRLLSVVAGGINPIGVAERARIAGRQSAIAGAIVRDTKNLLAAVAKNPAAADQARADCQARLDLNYRRIEALLGGFVEPAP